MSATAMAASIEDRLTAVEQAVAEIQRRLTRFEPDADWIERVTGSMEGRPEFEEVLRLGREIRCEDGPADLDEDER
jgi:hypothetical protein